MMKKKCLAILLCGLLSVSMLAGCGEEKEPIVASSVVVESKESGSKELAPSGEDSSKESQGSEEAGKQESADSSTEGSSVAEPEKNPNEELDAKAKQSYMDFLDGKLKLTTAEAFREDDEMGNYDGVTYGTYDYGELLKMVVENAIYEGSYTKYTFVDMGNDGVSEMALQLKSIHPSYINWTGIIHFDGENLKLNYSYTDGYRSEAFLYQNGSLKISGSAGAGAHVTTLYEFDREGFGKTKGTLSDYYGLFATNVVYDLPGENYAILDYNNEIWEESHLSLTEYKENGVVKICVTDWNEDATVKAKEEELVQKLKERGAIEISEEEMDALWKSVCETSAEVEWMDYFSEKFERDICSILEEGTYFTNQDTVTYNTENGDLPIVRVYATRDITNVKVLALSALEISDDGVMTFEAEEKFSVDTLKRGQDIMMGVAFAGDIPNNGISYVDVNGNSHAYSFNISGMDGSLVLEPAIIR